MADEQVEITQEEMTVIELPEEELEVEDTADGGAVIKLETVSI